ncbi:MAG: hypothetical protein IJF98_01000 [Firmicutes bacterium]|nr:hypothetical protein [Bacillota bacterium]
MNNIIEQKIKSLESAKKMYSLFLKIFENLILAKKNSHAYYTGQGARHPAGAMNNEAAALMNNE